MFDIPPICIPFLFVSAKNIIFDYENPVFIK